MVREAEIPSKTSSAQHSGMLKTKEEEGYLVFM